jgi:putative iron-dependent peroxidase
MTTPQPGIFAQGTHAHYHLELDARAGATPAKIALAIARLREPAVTSGGTNLVIGFGADLLRRIAPEAVPDDAQAFPGVTGDAGTVPATFHDLWVWLHGTGPDVLLDNARAVVGCLDSVLTLAHEQPCFVYHEGRDMTGFIDGTENPPVEEAPAVAIVPDGRPGEGGAHVITMQWVHDLDAFHALSVHDQEAVIGRTKVDSVERDDKPPSAHISRVVIEEDGEELEIYRRSTPYGTIAELGLYFVAFSADPSRFTKMLARMYDATGDGVHDRLTEFTRPVSAAAYFAPPLEVIKSLGT